jgi:hypothetical protein
MRKQAGRYTIIQPKYRQTVRQRSRQTDRQTGRQTRSNAEKQTDRQTDRHANRQTIMHTERKNTEKQVMQVQADHETDTIKKMGAQPESVSACHICQTDRQTDRRYTHRGIKI